MMDADKSKTELYERKTVRASDGLRLLAKMFAQIRQFRKGLRSAVFDKKDEYSHHKYSSATWPKPPIQDIIGKCAGREHIQLHVATEGADTLKSLRYQGLHIETNNLESGV